MISHRCLKLTLKGPILTRSTAIGGFGIDAPAARRPDGSLYLPGSLVTGRIRDAFRFLAQIDQRYADMLRLWFGGKDDEDTGLPRRRRLFISDLIFATQGAVTTRTRVAIDPVSGAVLEGALLVLESPFGAGELVTCEGRISALGKSGEADALWPALEKVLAWITQFGGLRTVGHGVLEKAKISEPSAQTVGPATPAADRLRIVLDIHDPLCVGETRNDPNTYISSDVIPGSAIKGTLAAMILAGHGAGHAATVEEIESGPLGRHFSALRFTHAFPVRRTEGAERPSRVPWSWVVAPKLAEDSPIEIYDAAQADEPAGAHLIGGKAPKFTPDWKFPESNEAERRVGWSSPETELRVRTAIDERFRSAKANRLFGIEYRVTTDHLWVGDLDLTAIPGGERAAVIRAVDDLLRDGIAGLGRSGSSASVTLQPLPPADPPLPDCQGRITLVLQSAALLRIPNPAARGDVTEAYRTAFHELAPDAGLNLIAIFVRERLSGADFMAKRYFGKDRPPYRPWLLTEPGSTFVFDIMPEERQQALNTIAGWERDGLNIPATTLGAYDLPDSDDLWRLCPFVRQNGHGEVASRTRLARDAKPVKPLRGTGVTPLPALTEWQGASQ